jgi:hypothetical protein
MRKALGVDNVDGETFGAHSQPLSTRASYRNGKIRHISILWQPRTRVTETSQMPSNGSEKP